MNAPVRWEVAVPLSEHEQKVLQQMEQALYAEDPRFASHITNHGLGRNRRRLILGIVGVVAGLALVVLSALNGLIWLGAVGFALMVAGGAVAFTRRRRPRSAPSRRTARSVRWPPVAAGPRASPSSAGGDVHAAPRGALGPSPRRQHLVTGG